MASSEAAYSPTTTTDAASGDATTTIRAQATDPTTAARSIGGRGHPPKVRGGGGPRQGGRSPQPPGADGSGSTSRK
jgi:hypothetical protein